MSAHVEVIIATQLHIVTTLMGHTSASARTDTAKMGQPALVRIYKSILLAR